MLLKNSGPSGAGALFMQDESLTERTVSEAICWTADKMLEDLEGISADMETLRDRLNKSAQ